MHHFRFTFCFVFLLLIGFPAPAQSDHFADDIQLTGTLGTKLKIEMILRTEKSTPFFSIKSADCLEVQGEYAYRTQIIPITISGRICPSNGSVLLLVGGERNEEERFEGKWNPTTKEIKGNWTLKKTGKSMPFSLSAMEATVKPSQVEGFFQVLNSEAQMEPHAEGARIEEANWTGKEGKIVGFQPLWGGDVAMFSPTRFEFYTYYTSTGRSSDYEEVYQLLPSPSGVFVARLFTYSGFEKGEDAEGNPLESQGGCGGELQVFQIVNGETVDVSEEKVPADLRVFDESASACVAHIISTAVYTPSGVKLNWNGLKFVK